jgi:hypothetical protein
MKTEEQILKKIETLQLELDSIHEERIQMKERYGGIDSEQNIDMLMDITTTADRIKMLQWVLN